MTTGNTAPAASAAFSNDRQLRVSHSGGFSVAAGTLVATSSGWEVEPMYDGLRFVILENGELTCRLPGLAQERIIGPSVCAIWNRGENESLQSFAAGSAVRYTAVSLPKSLMDQHFQAACERLFATLGIADTTRPHLAVAAATRPVRALCAQIATSPLRGLPRELYLFGKVLEIAAHALAAFDAVPAPVPDGALRLSTAEVERLHEARDRLAQRLRNPPSLAELSLSVGMNERKLNAGFQRLFGDSVFGVLQSLRLDTAYRLLTENEMAVSSAAYHVGYSPAHFSVAFRKRFGTSPRNVMEH